MTTAKPRISPGASSASPAGLPQCSCSGRGPARWVKLTSKKAAIEWAESLPDDEAPNA